MGRWERRLRNAEGLASAQSAISLRTYNVSDQRKRSYPPSLPVGGEHGRAAASAGFHSFTVGTLELFDVLLLGVCRAKLLSFCHNDRRFAGSHSLAASFHAGWLLVTALAAAEDAVDVGWDSVGVRPSGQSTARVLKDAGVLR